MKKVILSLVLVSVVSFGGSFKLGNTYFHENGSHHLATKAYSKKYNRFSNTKIRASYGEKYKTSSMKLQNTNNRILATK